jgi:hypothetical protein
MSFSLNIVRPGECSRCVRSRRNSIRPIGCDKLFCILDEIVLLYTAILTAVTVSFGMETNC